MTTRTFRLWLLFLYLAGVALLALPVIGFMHSVDYSGLLPIRSPDEGHYIFRMQSHLLRPFASVPDGVWFSPDSPPWLQVSLIEYFFGSIFSWTGLNSVQLSWLLLILFAPLSIPLIALISRRAGSPHIVALAAGVGFFVVTRLLTRLFHPSLSLPLTAFAFLLMWIWWDRPTRIKAAFAGFFSGILVGVYLWSWTFIVVTWALLGFLLLISKHSNLFNKRFKSLPFVGVAWLVGALPGLIASYRVSLSPYFAESTDRMGLLLSRQLESPARSLMLLVMTVIFLLALKKSEDREKYAPLLASMFALFIVYNQQLIHGRIMAFSSHYYTYVVMVAALMVAFGFSRLMTGFVSSMLIAVSLAPIFGEARDVQFWKQPLGFIFSDGTIHLKPAIDILNRSEGETVLTDGVTGNQVRATTGNGVAFVDYARILVISTQEYVERYCLAESFTAGEIDVKWLADFQEEKSRAARAHTKELYEKHLQMAKKTCPYVKSHVPEFLYKYRVTKVLWNEKLRPDWIIDTKLFSLIASGEGWSLWDVIPFCI